VVSQELDDWRVANVDVACGTWKGVFRWQFYKGELRQLGHNIQDFHRKLSGTLSFEPMEPNITLKMTGDHRLCRLWRAVLWPPADRLGNPLQSTPE
jgi:hypothetical protein